MYRRQGSMLSKTRGRISVLTHVVCLLGAIEEIIGTPTGCMRPLGMQSRAIRDSQLTASSSQSLVLSASAARLHNTVRMPETFGAWCAANEDRRQYLQIDLLTPINITAISTQGLEFPGGQWVTRYSVRYSCDGHVWQRYTVNNMTHEFQANNDTDSVVRNVLPLPITARLIRVEPLGWNTHGAICMRIELHGCATKQVCRPTAPPTPTVFRTNKTNTVRTTSSTTTARSTTTKSVKTTQATTHTTIRTAPATTKPSCTRAIGMESGFIADAQITASSHKSVSFLPAAGRLNNDYRTRALSFGAWCAGDLNRLQYLQVDLIAPTTLVAIATQGMAFVEGNWVESYTLSYSCDGVTWFTYEEDNRMKVFQANSNGRRIAYRELLTPITARLVRIRPVSWNSIGNICLRLELYGCNTSKVCTIGNKTEHTSPSTTSTKEATKQPTIQSDASRPITEKNGNTSRELDNKRKKTRKKITVIYIEEETPISAAKAAAASRTLVLLVCMVLILVWR